MGAVALLMVAVLGAAVGAVASWMLLGRSEEGASPRLALGTWDAVAHELERGRRYERPFALVRLPRDSFDEPGPPSDAAINAVVGSLRAIDFAWLDESGVHVLLPEARREEGQACISRLVEVAPSLAKVDAQLAVFPDDGVTRGALFSKLSGCIDLLPQAGDLPSSTRPDAPAAPRWAS